MIELVGGVEEMESRTELSMFVADNYNSQCTFSRNVSQLDQDGDMNLIKRESCLG